MEDKLKIIESDLLEKENLTEEEKRVAQTILNNLEGTLVIRATLILEFCLKAIKYTKIVNN